MPAAVASPQAPAAAPTIVPAKPVTVPTPPGVIHVTADKPLEPAKTEPTRREKLSEALRQKAKPSSFEAQSAPPEPVKSEAKPATETTTETDEETGETGTLVPKPGESAKPGDKPKVNPWKLLDEHKGRSAKLEQELADLRKLVPDAEARKGEIERLTKAEARNKELEDHIRFVDYSKSQEFVDKYQKPYEQAWTRAMSDLGELTVQTAGGQERAVKPEDILELVNLPLNKARELANEVFGDFANDVMAHRKEIRSLYERQAAALEEARTNGAQREKDQIAQRQAQQTEINDYVTAQWKAANESALKDEKYGALFAPVEGDQDGNQRLAKGFEMVDRAFSENPMDPKLTPDERKAIIQRHAAVRNRAAAFGRLNTQYQALKAKYAELEKKLAEFNGSVPSTEGSKPDDSATPVTARSSVFSALRKIAK